MLSEDGTLTVELARKIRDTLYPKARFKVLYGGRDGGKSWGVARYLVARAMAKQERILCTREIQESIADSVYQLIVDQIRLLGVEEYFEIQQKYIFHKTNGSRFAFHGLSGETAHSLKSFEGTTICWIEEAQTITKRSLRILTPTIRADDSEIIVTFNPDMDTDAVYERFVAKPSSDAIVTKVNFSDNPWKSKALDQERADMLRDDPDEFAHVYEGHCRPAVEGAIFFKEVSALRSSQRLTNVPYDPMLKAHVICDLGFNDRMALWIAQRRASEIRVIGYLEDRFRDVPYYDTELRKLNYNWGSMWLPPDGRAKTLAAASNPLGASVEEQFQTLKWDVQIVDAVEVEQGIRKCREVFPRVWIDRENAVEGLNRLGRYRRRVPKAKGTEGNAATPVHNDDSHGADGFRYLCLVADQLTNEVIAPPKNFYGSFMRRG